MLSSIKVPQIKVSPRGATNATSPKTPKGHSVPRTIVEITSVADGVRVVPTKSNGTIPATLRDFWAGRLIDHALILPRLG